MFRCVALCCAGRKVDHNHPLIVKTGTCIGWAEVGTAPRPGEKRFQRCASYHTTVYIFDF